ncbi:MAG: nucleotide exchange factor GrpE [Euzebyales bacterium]|jgi:molecular chaperone GrpE|nr:nucleotide exchange factor GrpE [Euzebyales bacterium]
MELEAPAPPRLPADISDEDAKMMHDDHADGSAADAAADPEPRSSAAEGEPATPAVEEDAAGEERAADDQRSEEELRAALEEAERSTVEYLDHLRRERAEFENYRRRANKERMAALDRGAEQLASSLLAVLDNFGYVLDAAKGSSDEQLAKGVGMVHGELLRALGEAGLEQITTVGVPFDPTVHEAVSQVEADEPVEDPVVAEILRPGYRFKQRVLRPASVSVAQ